MLIIDAVDVTKVYETRGITTRALDGVQLAVETGEFSAIAGPSGSGKTTLLNLLGALDVPTSGKIRLDGDELSALCPAALSELRLRKLGFVFQAYNLIPVLSARENVEFVMELQGTDARARGERHRGRSATAGRTQADRARRPLFLDKSFSCSLLATLRSL